MSEKLKKTKKQSLDASKAEAVIPPASKVSVKVSGGIHAGHDVVVGEQTNIYRQQIANINTPVAFVKELQRIHAQIAVLRQQPDLDPMDKRTVEIVEGRILEAAKEAKKPKPDHTTITSALEKAKKTMELLTGSIAAAAGLGAAIAGLIQLVGSLF